MFRKFNWDDASIAELHNIKYKAIVGDIVRVGGKKYKLTKRTSTAVALEPYYWYNELLDKVF